jgi:hypothetical protein
VSAERTAAVSAIRTAAVSAIRTAAVSALAVPDRDGLRSVCAGRPGEARRP